MWGHLQTETSLAGFKAGASFIGGLLEAREKRAWQRYNNAMVRIADAQNQNAITTNTNLAIERSTNQQYNIEVSNYTTSAQAEVAAAAAGVEGRSVNQTMFQIDANAAKAQSNRLSDLRAQLLSFENQRRTSAFQAAQQIDYTNHSGPNPLSALLGFASEAWNIQQKYNT
jgi:hypothetical protein